MLSVNVQNSVHSVKSVKVDAEVKAEAENETEAAFPNRFVLVSTSRTVRLWTGIAGRKLWIAAAFALVLKLKMTALKIGRA